MQTILVQILIGLAQITMAAFGGFLVERHIITGVQEQTLIAWVVNHTIIIAPIIAALALTLWQKYKSRVRMLIALQPGVHTENDVNAILASGAATPTILTPPSTTPGVPHPQVKP